MTAVNNSSANIDQLTNYIQSNTSNSGVTYGKNDVERLFAEIQYYNEGEEGSEKLQKQIDELEAKISTLQEEVNDLQKRIEDANLTVTNKGTELAKIVGQIATAEIEYQEEVQKAAEEAAKEAIEKYKNSDGETPFADIFGDIIDNKLAGLNLNSVKWLQIVYQQKSNEVTNVTDTIQGFLNETRNLQTKLDCTNATIKLLTRTKNNMASTMEGAYKNVDTNSEIPIYSGAKAELANSILEKYQTRNSEGDTSVAATASEADKAGALEKYSALKGDAKYTSGDRYSAQQNPELMNLRTLIEGGMIEDLQNNYNMSANEVMEFISTNWEVGISKTADGESWRIPKGHSSDAWVKEPAFEALTELCNKGEKDKTASSVNQDQMLELKSAVEEDDILTQMYTAGFTFKEAMYVLMQAFPDAGIDYNINSQETRNYSRVEDSKESGTLYKTIGDQILNYWNVGGTKITEKDEDSPSKPAEKFDPITFQSGNTTYTFVEDRDGDAMFDYTDGKNNELLGSQNGIQELINYDINGDGVINDKDIMKDENGNDRTITNVDGTTRKMTALDALTLMSNRQEESIANSTDVNGYKYGANYKDKGVYTNAVDFNITYTSAADLGITEIDLSSLQEGTGTGEVLGDSTRTYDGHQEEFEDINGSSIINQFSIKTDGTKLDTNITANETLNTEDNLKTFYESVAKSASTNSNLIYSRLTTDDVKAAFNDGEWAVEGMASIDTQLDTIKDNLEDLLEQAKKEDETVPQIDVTIEELEQQCEDEKDIIPDTGDITFEEEEKDDEEEEKVDNNANDDPPAITDAIDTAVEVEEIPKKEIEDNPNINVD